MWGKRSSDRNLRRAYCSRSRPRLARECLNGASGPGVAAELRPFRVAGTVRPSDLRKPTPPELTHSRLRVVPVGVCRGFPPQESTEFTTLPPRPTLAGNTRPVKGAGRRGAEAMRKTRGRATLAA